MKVAVLIAKFPSGYVAEAGEDSATLKAAFKEIKSRGYLVRGEETAEVVYFINTAGEMLRKFLGSVSAAEAIAASKAEGLARIEQHAAEQATTAAKAEGADKARATATEAVRLIAAAVAAAPHDPAALLRDLDRANARLATAEAEIARLTALVAERSTPAVAPIGPVPPVAPIAPAALPTVPPAATPPPAPTPEPTTATPAASEPSDDAEDSADPEERFGGNTAKRRAAAKR